MIPTFINILAITEISILLIALIGIFVIIKDKTISNSAKVIWIFSILIFNIIALIVFLFWKKITPKTEKS
jgi:hypothetical protein